MATESLDKILSEARIRPLLTDLLTAGDECCLVGGTLRDWLLGRPVTDFDFATPGDPTALARRFAHAVDGSWFLLDPQRRQSRVVVRGAGAEFTYDFAPWRGPDLEADLRGRDFTVNALALPLAAEGQGVLLDPLGGRSDLDLRLLRDCSADAFRDDPLRILRGVRHAVTLGFQLDASTAGRMRAAVVLLPQAAPERIRAELAAILAAAPVSRGLSLLREFALLPQLFGPPGSDAAVVEGMRLAAAVEASLTELAAADASGEIARLCGEELDDGFSRLALLKLAGFLRRYAPVDLRAVLSNRLRLSRNNNERLRSLCRLPAALATELPALPAGRGRALWAEDLGAAPVESLLFLAVLDEPLRRSPALLLAALRDLRAEAGSGRIPSLVDGCWLRERLGLGEGPAVGTLLAQLRRAEMAGRVRTRAEAEAFLLAPPQKSVDKKEGDPL